MLYSCIDFNRVKGTQIKDLKKITQDTIQKANRHVYDQNYKEAINLYKEALKQMPNEKMLYFNIGVNHIHLKEYFNATEYLQKALIIDPNYTKALINIAIAYKKSKEFQKSLYYLNKVQILSPNDPDIYYNKANIYSNLENYDEAIKSYHIVLELDKNYHKAYHGIGLVYNHQMQYKKAYQYFDKCLSLKPDYADSIFAKSLIELRYKDYLNGWKHYEQRWEATNPLEKLSYDVSFYNGEDLSNKTILIQEEQGFGDNIQFIRYIELLQKKNPKRIYIAVRKELIRIFELIPNITIVTDEDVVYGVDYITSLLSFPYIFKTTYETIPNKVPYIPVPEEKSKKSSLIKKSKKLKIAFAYQGNKDHTNDKYRSIPFETFKTLFELNNVEFYSFQFGEDKDLQEYIDQNNHIIDCTGETKDFYESAILLDKIDIIISIDSALAHFGGALNKKTFLLVPQNAEWRWFEDIKYSPWYPSIQIFRQKKLGFWLDTMEEIKKELKKLS